MSDHLRKIYGGKGASSQRSAHSPQSSKFFPQNILSLTAYSGNLNKPNGSYFSDTSSPTSTFNSDGETNSFLSSANSSPSTASSSLPPQDNLSPTLNSSFLYGRSRSPSFPLDTTEHSLSNVNLGMIPQYGDSSTYEPSYSQHQLKYDEQFFLTFGSAGSTFLGMNNGDSPTGSDGCDVTSASDTNQSYHTYHITNRVPNYTVVDLIDTRSTAVRPGAIPEDMTLYKNLRCAICNDADMTYYTEASWLIHLWKAHPEWIVCNPVTFTTEWKGVARCNACINSYDVYHNEVGWRVHVWMAHPEWISRIPETCFWLGCEDTTFESRGSWFAHLWEVHPNWGKWGTPRSCIWEDCTSKCRPFKTANLWLAHVKQKHQKSYWCKFSGCELGTGASKEKAFGTKHDLDRHRQQVHEPRITCQLPFCQGRAKLARPDKLELHNKLWHGPWQCEVSDCPRQRINGIDYGFSTQDDLQKHTRERHHRYRM